MSKTLRVIAFEFINTLKRPSFLLATFVLPIISLSFFAVLTRWNREETSNTSTAILEAAAEISGAAVETTVNTEGYVDKSGLIETLPDSISEDLLRAYPDEQSAMQALQAGEISAYYLISADYLTSGKVIFVEQDFNPLAMFSKGDLLQWILRVNLLDGDARRVNQIENPLDLEVTILEMDSERDEANPLTMLIPYGIMIMFFSIMLSSSSLFLKGLSAEYNNNMLEIILTTISTRQLLTGKIIGLGVIGLLQTILWLGSSLVLLRGSGDAFSLSEVYQLPVSIMIWGAIYYLLAYLLYASFLAGLGALLPSINEISQFSTLVMLPLITPAFMVFNFIRDPNGVISTVLSLFPLTAPISMLTRLAATDKVPLWQPLLSATLLACSVVIAILFAAQIFRANNLFVGQPLRSRIKLLITELLR
jgi:ABC-2 type transport system permease protein